MHPKTTLANSSRTLAVLLEIYLNPGDYVQSIQKRVNLSGAGVARHLERLAAAGLIEPRKTLKPQGNGRKSMTRRPVATPKGEAVILQLEGVL